MQKSVSKRIKVTGTGKLMRRRMGIDHFKAKKSGNQTRRKRLTLAINRVDVKLFKKYLSA